VAASRSLTTACLSVTNSAFAVTIHFANRLLPAYLRKSRLLTRSFPLFTDPAVMQTVKGFAAEQPGKISRSNRRTRCLRPANGVSFMIIIFHYFDPVSSFPVEVS